MEYFLNKYVIFKKYEDTVIGANLLDNILFAISVEKYKLLEEKKDDLIFIKNENYIFFSAMLKLGVIVPEKQDAYKQLLLHNRLLIFSDNTYRLTINPTLNCNCNCWYCYETHGKKIMPFQYIDRIEKLIENIIVNRGIKKLYLDWFGGEPLLCYNNRMIPICRIAKNICDKHNVNYETGITTNGYLLKKDMIDFFKEVNMNSFQITLDGDRDNHNKTRLHNKKNPTFDKIIENLCLLADRLKPHNLALRINYTNENFDSITNIIHYIPSELRPNITILLQQVWQDKEKNKITVPDIEGKKAIFKDAGFKVNEEILNMKCYTCYADKYNQAVINFDGRVFKCTARNFNEEQEDGVLDDLGNINWNTNRLSYYLANATFENEKCKECIYLPVCFGACSKKMAMVNDDITQLEKFCFKSGIEATLDYIMEKFSQSNKAISAIINV